ncbi:RNA polymerase sigma factor [Paenibacillus sp. UNC499MF]|uniref:RNA polymerase sigma factor n=1 Tax=Paenibacillus sp. UNC499MF TaxID=1502751 RepID=UPI0008A08D69|nr:RNA polymerase sigma factor [Paenibacillus sp. UNC499MF]SEG44654.1 RNA polymerase sigma-70 factor, ECF subfamily [Paenibacillus sp. UNC499MF]
MAVADYLLKGKEKDSSRINQLQQTLKRYCLSMTKSTWDAEDLAQETWLRAISSQGKGHGNVEATLLRIAKNVWIDQSRRKQVLARIMKNEQAQALTRNEGILKLLELEEIFLALVKHLPPLQRTVFLLRDVLGFSSLETAVRLGTTEGAVKAALHRARQSLEAVRRDIETSTHDAPSENGMKAYLRMMAAAYEMGDIALLVELAQRDEVEPAVALGLAQNHILRSGRRRKNAVPHIPGSLKMSA